MREGRELEVGDRVRVSGGYGMDPPWLAGGHGYTGEVVAFMPGENAPLSALVLLDEELMIPNALGRWAVLSLDHQGATWAESRPRVHVEICDSRPSIVAPRFRVPGIRVESHATYDVISTYGPGLYGKALESVQSRLEEIQVDLSGWQITDRDPLDGSTWIRDYP